jgi:threonine/homoserine/homoserine lactone efflux protein
VNQLLTTLVSIAIFGFVTSVTPGPNNTYLLTSGMNFGVRKSLTYVNGIMVGLIIMISAMYLGVDVLFKAYPFIPQVMKYAGFAYILYLAFKIVQSSFVHKHEQIERVGFFRATAFQLINPKAWFVILAAVPTYVQPTTSITDAVLTFAVFLIFTYPGAVIWAVSGDLMAGLLSKPTPKRIFNISAAILLVVSMIPVLFF